MNDTLTKLDIVDPDLVAEPHCKGEPRRHTSFAATAKREFEQIAARPGTLAAKQNLNGTWVWEKKRPNQFSLADRAAICEASI